MNTRHPLKTFSLVSMAAFFGVAVLTVLWTGCSSNNNPTAPPTPVPAAPSNTPTITVTPTVTPTKTATATPTNSSTPLSTYTPTNSPTLTPTDTPTNSPTDTPSATPSATPTATTCSNYGLTDANTSNPLGGTGPGAYYTNQVTLLSPTTAQSLNVRGVDFNTSIEPVYLALYDAASGNQLAYGYFYLDITGSSGSGGINTWTLNPPVSLSPGTYNLVVCIPTGTVDFEIGESGTNTSVDEGSYAGGVPPANYSSFTSGTGGFLSIPGQTLFFQGCP